MVHNAVAVSAPGKVLLAGGYLCLDRTYTALVFGLDARIHVVVRPIPTRRGVELSEIEVTSPQFQEAAWNYGYRLGGSGSGMSVTQLRMDADLHVNRNVFIETTLGYALSYISAITSPTITPASITILADNDYYSTPAAPAATSTQPRFRDFGVKLRKAHKTGLGSSAALVTAITAAVLSYYLPSKLFDLDSDRSKRIIHNLAQAAHCAAQGKVGSGFDVASAVYGSCLYRRFSPTILSKSADPGTSGFSKSLRELVEELPPHGQWNTEIHRDAVKVPKGLRLLMCDVSGGSETPGMVKKVLAWRQENPAEANEIWSDLHAANDSLAKELRAMAEAQDFGLERLRSCFTRIRRGIKIMSEKSGVPIEPAEQTELINACEAVPGVIGGVVPGAGGYDAISLLIEDREETVAALQKLFDGWNVKSEHSGKVSILGVRQDMQGVRVEQVDQYQEWLPPTSP
ncbi:ribosomal protein S5 domain 2-type protein [Neohortaea acidophila]|uniref:Phosphomevalonate kinase n=1 Tax=Neohortaea acidophila TaxID=245834 RepID=A0A6A6PSD2_9PEZI|nr:ribosomal protein S5 domain 2-type protein [Neohortaea acidophila]KAF2482892.1 ribosomal protein S5 domain 2-type protein [Neohortaea acidophila]